MAEDYGKMYGKNRRVVAYPKPKYFMLVAADAANEGVSKSYLIAKIVEKYYDTQPTSTIDKLKTVYNNLDENEK
jgi:hypothetical protein